MSSTNGASRRQYGTTAPISSDGPRDEDKISEQNLDTVMSSFDLIESTEESERRETVLGDLNEICQQWVQDTTLKQGMSEQMASESVAKLYTYGSYRLGVHNTGTDIDTLCVGPRHITHEHFFDELCETLKAHPEVEELSTVPGAYVPIAKFKFRGISIDLIYAKVALDIIPDDFDIFDDNNLKAADEKSVRSLNGARVTDMILTLVPCIDVFRNALRAVKFWAKKRGIYSNVIGYPGGVSYAILVARVAQLYPNANSAMLVANFFRLYHLWKWDKVPVTLNKIVKDSALGYTVWDPNTNYHDRNDKMPIITPAYPAMNSTHNVSKTTLSVIKEELERANELCRAQIPITPETWHDVFKPYDFFLSHKMYLQIMCYSDTAEAQQVWIGWVESKIRRLVLRLEDKPFLNMRPYPYPVKCSDKDHPNCQSFFIGAVYSPPKSSKIMLRCDITKEVTEFRRLILSDKYSPQTEGMHIQIKLLTPHTLPEYVFPDDRRPPKKKKKKKKIPQQTPPPENDEKKIENDESMDLSESTKKRKLDVEDLTEDSPKKQKTTNTDEPVAPVISCPKPEEKENADTAMGEQPTPSLVDEGLVTNGEAPKKEEAATKTVEVVAKTEEAANKKEETAAKNEEAAAKKEEESVEPQKENGDKEKIAECADSSTLNEKQESNDKMKD